MVPKYLGIGIKQGHVRCSQLDRSLIQADWQGIQSQCRRHIIERRVMDESTAITPFNRKERKEREGNSKMF